MNLFVFSVGLFLVNSAVCIRC